MPFRAAAIAVLGALLFCGGFAAWRVSVHNEAVVEPARLYRSAQLSPAEIRGEIAQNGIRTVINLRGENKDATWYKDELAICRDQGVQHVDVRLSAKQLPPPAELDKLLDALQNAPRPILVHCRSGSDRTGLASCIFLIDQDHVAWKKAENALSWRYGHFGVYPYFAMDKFIQLYGQSSNPSLDDWARRTYPSIYANEMRKSKSEEMAEPLELMIHGRLN